MFSLLLMFFTVLICIFITLLRTRENMKKRIDINKAFSLILDETPDKWGDLSVVNVMYCTDPFSQPMTLDVSEYSENYNECVRE